MNDRSRTQRFFYLVDLVVCLAWPAAAIGQESEEIQNNTESTIDQRLWLPVATNDEQVDRQALGSSSVRSGCTNIIRNPNFDQGTANWQWYDQPVCGHP